MILDLRDGYEFQKEILEKQSDQDIDKQTKWKSTQTVEIETTNNSVETWNVYTQTDDNESLYVSQIRLLREKYDSYKAKYKNLKDEYRKIDQKLKYVIEVKEKYQTLYNDCHELLKSITNK